MPLPTNFSGRPTEEPHRYFRNVCIQFRKAILSLKDRKQLEEEIENFINASKQMNWHVQSADVFQKNEGEKAVQKVLTESERYYKSILNDDPAPNQDLLDALNVVEQLIDSQKVN
ncbi:MAG TPA: hypothetical protein VGJ00_08240 [Rhabdochlamydiaceae bacterium]|jgi:hypothetical protein